MYNYVLFIYIIYRDYLYHGNDGNKSIMLVLDTQVFSDLMHF